MEANVKIGFPSLYTRQCAGGEMFGGVGLQREFPGRSKSFLWIVPKIEFRVWLQLGGGGQEG